eukprot:scaffold5956_cov89-Skeletonema_dohrnii-CCMP3373.AAC.2
MEKNKCRERAEQSKGVWPLEDEMRRWNLFGCAAVLDYAYCRLSREGMMAIRLMDDWIDAMVAATMIVTVAL